MRAMIDGLDVTRVQLSRRKGWRMPENTVSVARPTKYGNPFRISHVDCELGGMCWEVSGQVPAMPGAVLAITADHIESKSAAAGAAVGLFRQHCFTEPGVRDVLRATLAGKNLACWCPLSQPCHADVLLEIANAHVAYVSAEQRDDCPEGPADGRRPIGRQVEELSAQLGVAAVQPESGTEEEKRSGGHADDERCDLERDLHVMPHRGCILR